jgi:hypothetical protein
MTLSFTVSEKNAGQRNLLFGHIGRPEVNFEKMKKTSGRFFKLNKP